LKLGKKRRESSKRNYYIISPRVIIKAIIVTPKNLVLIITKRLKKTAKILGSALCDALLKSRVQKFAPKKEIALRAVFLVVITKTKL